MPNRSRPRTKAPRIDSAVLRATAAATAGFARRLEAQFAPDYFRPTTFDLRVSSLGIGTYLGDTTDADDAAYAAAIQHAVRSGMNVIDTAINYRAQRSERAVGSAIQALMASGEATRGEIVVCTKGGYIPLDRDTPATRDDYQAYVRREFLDRDIVRPDEIVAGGHSLAPRFLRYCLAKSRQNLGLRTVDVYYLHNPEQQLRAVERAEVLARMRLAFAMLEEAVERGEIGVYGCATWDGLRLMPDAPAHLSLAELVAIAREVAGDGHHFRAVQLPVNLAMPEAVKIQSQQVNDRLLTVAEAATELGLTVFASAALMQSRLASGLPESVREVFPGFDSDAQRALAFSRTLPGVTTALVGMKQLAHVDENVAAARAAG